MINSSFIIIIASINFFENTRFLRINSQIYQPLLINFSFSLCQLFVLPHALGMSVVEAKHLISGRVQYEERGRSRQLLPEV